MDIVSKKNFLVAGIKVSLKEEELFTKLPKVYEELMSLKDKIHHKKSEDTIEITIRKENNVHTILVGYEVTQMSPLPNIMVGMKIPDAKYLYNLHKGEVTDLYSTYVLMYDYALENGLSIDKEEFKIEIHDVKEDIYHLYIKIN